MAENDYKMAPKVVQSNIRMISGCEDKQTSSDVSNVASFQLPDPEGRAGGALTSALLNVLYEDEQTPEDEYSFIEVLQHVREMLKSKGFQQKPQLTSSRPLDLSHKFDLVPPEATGTRRALLIGINYVGHSPGELRGCHNDVGNMVNYIKNVHDFEDQNIKILMDDGSDEHTPPTKSNMLAAYKKIVSESKAGDAIFLHYSGHGAKVKDISGDEDDGYDEALVPIDFKESGLIIDDILYDIVVNDLPAGVYVVAIMDCCHSGSVMDLPYTFVANDGEFDDNKMKIDESFNFDRFLRKIKDAREKIRETRNMLAT